MRLYLVRHPRTAIAADICYGTTDVPVPQETLESSLASLTPGLPQGVPIISSPLQRCARLAERLAPALGAPPVCWDARLREMDFGDWEMRSWQGIPRHEVDAWAADLVDYRPGGKERVLDVAERIVALCRDLDACGRAELILVCHAGTIRLLCAATGMASEGVACPTRAIAHEAALAPHRIAYGSVTVIERYAREILPVIAETGTTGDRERSVAKPCADTYTDRLAEK